MKKYDIQQSWSWNLQNAPPLRAEASRTPELRPPGAWAWCGLPVQSPLGIPAGPLLNARWVLAYADLDFDILVYKTVRTRARDCYPVPNLVPVDTTELTSAGTVVSATATMRGSWAVSFGMPSQPPEVWRNDVAVARDRLPSGKVLIVSVVGTQKSDLSSAAASVDSLADDFALCAQWAVGSGAHGIEANFSCPNVSTVDGQLYQQPEAAGLVAARIRDRIGAVPLVLKIGHLPDAAAAEALLQQVGPHINGLAMTNSVAARVTDTDGTLLFDGRPRGICGAAIRAASVAQVRQFRDLLSIVLPGRPLDLIGVGGISTGDHVREYLGAGASSVALATAAMTDPHVGLSIRQRLSDILPLQLP